MTTKEIKAFPYQLSNHAETKGMDLRDYFAAKAMQAYITGVNADDGVCEDGIAIYAYRMADAIIKEREV